MPQITVSSQDKTKCTTVSVATGETVLAGLKDLDIVVEGCCGGRGTCGKCAVYYESKAPDAYREEMWLGAEQIAAGLRLACFHKVTEDIRIRLAGSMHFSGEYAPKMQIEGADVRRCSGGAVTANQDMAADADITAAKAAGELEYTVILDIGTTTLAAAFVRESDFGIERVLTRENSGRRFGSDVISRIHAANEGSAAALQAAAWADIHALFETFTKEKHLPVGGTIRFRKLVVSANTVMEHLLLGYSLRGLGEAPFQPVSLALTEQKKKEIFPEQSTLEEMSVLVLPGISAFVGADIVAGLYAVSMDQEKGVTLFADIGTNGEMALGVNGKIYATAASAGPAFEGANIRDGVAGIEGAIQQANLLGGRLVVGTIGAKPPVGICGTGVLELASELYRGGILDRHGTFTDGTKRYPVAKRADGSEICFTQEDMRQLQMAKSAIRSGMELLLKKAGVNEDAVKKVWLAGGFGCKINVHKAALLGLLPKKLEKKTEAVGNTALIGAYRFEKACRENGRLKEEQRLKALIEQADVLNLAEQPEFETYYLRNMDF